MIVSGVFDPLHSGHIAYFNKAKALGDILVVALNSDDWLKKKKDRFFMPFNERKIVLSKNETFHVKKEMWHQAINLSKEPCHIIEIQYSPERKEDDIDRHSYYLKNEDY